MRSRECFISSKEEWTLTKSELEDDSFSANIDSIIDLYNKTFFG